MFEQFPSEEKGIEEYFQSVKEAAIAFNRSLMFKTLPLSLVKFIIWIKLLQFLDWGYSKWASISLQQALEKMTQNKELQSLLASNYGLCGTDPSRSPFILHAAIMSGGRHGAYYPNGGPSTIPNKIIKNLVAHQGQVMVCANVKQILVEKEGTMNVCKGVEMSDGTKIQAKAVVSDTGLINTANHMLPAGILQLRVDDDHISPQSTKHLHPSQTCLSLFVGLQMDPDTLNLPKAGIFFIHPSNDLISNMEKLEMMTVEEALSNDSITDTMEGEELHLGPIFVNPACVHDKSWPQDFPDKSTIEILALCPYSWFAKFEHDKDKDYEEMKTRFADKTWQRVVDILGTDCPKLPRSLEGVDNFKLGTPLTLAHFLASDHGAMIGLDHNMKRFEPEFHFLRLRSKVPEVSGLFITGQDIVCAGFPGAMVGGLFCAATMLGVGDPFTLVVDKDSK